MLSRFYPLIAGVPFQVGVGGRRERGLASLRTRADPFSSVSYIEVPSRVSFEERPCLLNDICKALEQSTIIPCFSGLKIKG